MASTFKKLIPASENEPPTVVGVVPFVILVVSAPRGARCHVLRDASLIGRLICPAQENLRESASKAGAPLRPNQIAPGECRQESVRSQSLHRRRVARCPQIFPGLRYLPSLFRP